MEEAVFEREMIKARTMIDLGDRPDYWRGYERGLRRAYHGETFGTEAEHGQWLALVFDQDQDRKDRGEGYLAGLEA